MKASINRLAKQATKMATTTKELQVVYNQRFDAYDALMRAYHTEEEWESKPTDSLVNFATEALVARRTLLFGAPVSAKYLAAALALARVQIAIDILCNSNLKRMKRAQKRALRYARL